MGVKSFVAKSNPLRFRRDLDYTGVESTQTAKIRDRESGPKRGPDFIDGRRGRRRRRRVGRRRRSRGVVLPVSQNIIF